MTFRKDINGLRAIAVLAVIIFHFNPRWLPGGFAGVDVFFVISGFLMTSIIFSKMDNNTFSLLKFYSARICRIIPALLSMIVVLTVVGYFYFAPSLYNEFAKHAESSLLFISNITYLKESGYFDTASIGKILLHTWSLSIEWQFYIIYPIVLMAISKLFSRNVIKKIILITVFVSFAFAVYASYQWPIASYFSILTSSWELLLGGVAFLYPVNFKNFWQKNVCGFTGLFLILLSFFIYSSNTLWPSYYSLVPTLGAFLLIVSCSNSLVTNNLIFQKLGLWSYSLYLYHWPILAVSYRLDFNIGFFLFFSITLTLSIISYYFIEIKKWKTRYTLSFLIITLIPLFAIQQMNGISSRLAKSSTLNNIDYMLSMNLGHNIIGRNGSLEMNVSENILNNKPGNRLQAVLIGDSQAAHYSFGISESENKIPILIKWVSSCLNLPDYFSKPRYTWQDKYWAERCKNNTIEKEKLKGIPLIISQDWSGYDQINEYQCKNDRCSDNNNKSNFYELFDDQLTKIVNIYSTSPIILIGTPPFPNEEILNCYKNQLSDCQNEYPEISNKIINRNNFLKKMANKHGIYFIDPSIFLCANGKCKASIDGYSLYFDTGHFSAYGSKYVWGHIENELINKGLLRPTRDR